MPVSTKSMVRWGFWGSLLLLTIAVGALRHHSGVRAYPHLQDVTPEKLPVYDVLVQAVGAIERFDKDAFLRLYRPGPEGGMRNALAGWYENKWLWRQKAQGIRDQMVLDGEIHLLQTEPPHAVFPYTYREFKRLKHARVLLVETADAGWRIQDLNY